jgi:peptidyl-tRNA hydrolase, PTH2 family
MQDVKQVIVMRKDLNMRKGKMVAQGSHASVKVVLDTLMASFESADRDDTYLWQILPDTLYKWAYRGKFTKICVGVDSESELLEIYEKALQDGLLCSLITDSGQTEFNGVPTITCCAIGPDYTNDIDKITGHLKLL